MNFIKINSKLINYSTIGLELGLSVIIGLVVGQFLDDFFGTEPWLFLLFLIFGLVAGYRSVFRLLRKMKSDQPEKDEHE